MEIRAEIKIEINPDKEIRICKGCGHIAGDTVGAALACCPDNDHVPVREFVEYVWNELVSAKQQAVTIKENMMSERDIILRYHHYLGKNGCFKKSKNSRNEMFRQVDNYTATARK